MAQRPDQGRRHRTVWVRCRRGRRGQDAGPGTGEHHGRDGRRVEQQHRQRSLRWRLDTRSHERPARQADRPERGRAHPLRRLAGERESDHESVRRDRQRPARQLVHVRCFADQRIDASRLCALHRPAGAGNRQGRQRWRVVRFRFVSGSVRHGLCRDFRRKRARDSPARQGRERQSGRRQCGDLRPARRRPARGPGTAFCERVAGSAGHLGTGHGTPERPRRHCLFQWQPRPHDPGTRRPPVRQ